MGKTSQGMKNMAVATNMPGICPQCVLIRSILKILFCSFVFFGIGRMCALIKQ